MVKAWASSTMHAETTGVTTGATFTGSWGGDKGPAAVSPMANMTRAIPRMTAGFNTAFLRMTDSFLKNGLSPSWAPAGTGDMDRLT
jgi:hypothetical protein